MNSPSTFRLLRHASRRVAGLSSKPQTPFLRPLSTSASHRVRITPARSDKNDPYHKASTEATGTSAGPHEGSASRTDREIVVEYPDEDDFPRDRPLRGRGGVQYVRTLPAFSLEGRTAVVTGGARGLGLVMGQALVQSGADLAIVDLNSKISHLKSACGKS
jgi:D-arabinitol 2-dehydrogenase